MNRKTRTRTSAEPKSTQCIKQSNLILIDTCSMMQVEYLDRFLREYARDFKKNKKKIVVIPAVQMELIKHLDSQDEEKAKMFSHVLISFFAFFSFRSFSLAERRAAASFPSGSSRGTRR